MGLILIGPLKIVPGDAAAHCWGQTKGNPKARIDDQYSFKEIFHFAFHKLLESDKNAYTNWQNFEGDK